MVLEHESSLGAPQARKILSLRGDLREPVVQANPSKVRVFSDMAPQAKKIWGHLGPFQRNVHPWIQVKEPSDGRA